MTKVSEVIKSLDLGSLSEVQLKKIAELKQEELRLSRDGKLWLYEPQPQQLPFHKSLARIRWAFGGNRGGKTIVTHAEGLKLATGTNEYRPNFPIPNHGWICSVDYPTSRDVSEAIVFDYLPKSKIREWNKTDRVIHLTCGSTIGFKSYDSGRLKFQGTSRHWIIFDEEPPYDIYQECLMRLIDTNGLMMCGETPTLGMSWTYDEICEQEGLNPNIAVFHLSMLKNPHLKKEAVEEAIATMNPEEREMRIEGKHIQLSGRVFREYDRDVHVIPAFEIPNNWDWSKFRGVDHGTNNPTACIWVAINKDGDWYIYDEYYESNKTIQENCTAIKTISGGDKYDWTAIDGSTKNVESTRKSSYYEEYKKEGVYAKPIWLNEMNVSLAINSIRGLLRVDERKKKPKLYIFSHCVNFIKEFSRYRWKDHKNKDSHNLPEKPQGDNDHAITAFMFVVLSKARWQGIDKMTHEPETIKWY